MKCKEHDIQFPCAECERVRSFGYRVLCVSAATAMLATLVVLWEYQVMEPSGLRIITTVEALLFLGLIWAYRGANKLV